MRASSSPGGVVRRGDLPGDVWLDRSQDVASRGATPLDQARREAPRDVGIHHRREQRVLGEPRRADRGCDRVPDGARAGAQCRPAKFLGVDAMWLDFPVALRIDGKNVFAQLDSFPPEARSAGLARSAWGSGSRSIRETCGGARGGARKWRRGCRFMKVDAGRDFRRLTTSGSAPGISLSLRKRRPSCAQAFGELHLDSAPRCMAAVGDPGLASLPRRRELQNLDPQVEAHLPGPKRPPA